MNTFNTTNKSSSNKINNQSKTLIYNVKPDSMQSLIRKYHKKFTSLKNLVPPTENKELKQEVLINAGDIYNYITLHLPK